MHLVDTAHPQESPLLIQKRKTGLEYDVEERDGVLYIISNNDGCENYKLSTASLKNPQCDAWQDLYTPATGVLLDDLLVSRNFIARLEIKEGLPELTIVKENGDEHKVAFPEEAYDLEIISTLDYNSPMLRFSYSSMTTPTCIYDYDTRKQTRTLLKQQKIPSGHNPADYVSKRLSVPADDGSSIPVSLLYRQDTVLDGNTPLLLYGYGAYGSSMPTSFSPHRLSLVNRGFIYAIAHIRGGMEKGYAWYRQGKLTKQKKYVYRFY